MNTTQIVEQVKEVIIKELLTDVDDKHCVLDLCIENRNSQTLSKVSQVFLDNKKIELTKEYNSGKILFFRKYNYEKILIQYLENKYNVDDIEFNLFPSDKRKRELEEKQKQELEEQQCRNFEETIIKQIPYMKWEKTVRVSSNVYTAIDKNGKKIELYYVHGKLGKHNSIANKLTYDNQPLKYAEYDVKTVVDIIENTHPKNLKADHIVMVTRPEYSKGVRNTKKQEKEDKKEAKRKKKIEEQKRYNALLDAKEQYINDLIKEYGIKRQDIENYAGYYQNRCKYVNKNIVMSCRFQDRPCTVFFSDCPHNHQFIHMLKEEKRKKLQFKPESISVIARRYNTTENNVKCIAGIFKSKCSHYEKEKCSCEQMLLSSCSLQNPDCIFHDEFLERMKKHSEKILRKQENQIVAKEPKKEITSKSEPSLPEIGLKDFVVRANVFKCMHNKHKIDNVVAMINIDDNGKRKQIKISAGYCSQCKIYFIMDSTYQNLKKKGMVLCRVTDEKNYMKGGYVNGIKLAQESLLMQYGYNVSQTEGLTATARQKILAVIIDNKIMSKSEIISYIDFFISQRSSNSRMEVAISKWEADREFVENYRIGEYTQFGVNAIYRR